MMTDDDKTELPTSRRLQKALEEGQVARSIDLSAAVITVGSMGLLLYMGRGLFDRMTHLFAKGFEFDRMTLDRPQMLIGIMGRQIMEGLIVVSPIIAFTLIAACVAGMSMSGIHFSSKAYAPKFEKLDPIKGLGRIFGKQAWVELAKSIVKFSLVSVILWMCVSHFLPDLLMLGQMELEPALSLAGSMLTQVAIFVSLGLVLIALIDVPYQKHTYIKGLKMTRQEVKDEMKNAEGSPEVKSEIRRRQREMANARMMQRVKDADVVITNPEHFAVALEYDPSGDGAPILVAKGSDHMAARIRAEAQQHGIYIFQAPPLARALYFTTQAEHPIPEELYHAVAQVIAYVFSLEAAAPMQGPRPKPTVKVPESMLFNPDGSKFHRAGVHP
jgi:flagellar biosynthesis protein FlhB